MMPGTLYGAVGTPEAAAFWAPRVFTPPRLRVFFAFTVHGVAGPLEPFSSGAMVGPSATACAVWFVADTPEDEG